MQKFFSTLYTLVEQHTTIMIERVFRFLFIVPTLVMALILLLSQSFDIHFYEALGLSFEDFLKTSRNVIMALIFLELIASVSRYTRHQFQIAKGKVQYRTFFLGPLMVTLEVTLIFSTATYLLDPHVGGQMLTMTLYIFSGIAFFYFIWMIAAAGQKLLKRMDK